MMARRVAAVFCVAALAACAAALRAPKCNMSPTQYPSYPPPANATMPRFTVNLDLPPAQRWVEIATHYKTGIASLLELVMSSAVSEDFVHAVTKEQDTILAAFPAGYGDELHGIANATGMEVSKFIIFNMAYELLGLCTSIVAEDDKGHVYHARNLDFGLWPAFDAKGGDWTLTERLRPLLYQADVMRGGKVLYHITNYAGYIGVHTWMKPGAFSVTIDSRFDDHFVGLIKWLLPGSKHAGHFVTFATRQAMETSADYPAALSFLNKTSLIGPAYIIIGGAKAGEGAVITKDGAETLDVMTIARQETKAHEQFVVETNYDNWKAPPFFDDRRVPAIDCLKELGPAKTNLPNLFNLLSAQPNLNRLTTFTVLIDVAADSYESYKQRCAHEGCTLW